MPLESELYVIQRRIEMPVKRIERPHPQERGES